MTADAAPAAAPQAGDPASAAQNRAADPRQSTWLSANAGSGKTRVLTDRVARLLLGGVLPAHILCLTYTKAAATEMQNRLFRRLGDWAMLPSEALRHELGQLGETGAMTETDLARARTLFARAIEAPGGLRIQTIHAFCASLLRRFPLEAGISPQFTEMEDRAKERLIAETLDRMAEGADAPLLRTIAEAEPDTLDALAAAVLEARAHLQDSPDRDAIRRAYGLAPGMTEARLLASVFSDAALLADLKALIPALETSGSNDQGLAAALQTVLGPDLAAMRALEQRFLTGKGAKKPFSAKTGAVPTKGFDKIRDIAALRPRIDAFMNRLEAGREIRLALDASARDAAVADFASAFLARFEAAKQARGWLDFDDLISRTLALLSDPVVADWVLYRLDGGLDHILVDEAQDTSAVQWQVIERLARELVAGDGAAPERLRTIFVVGDKKQSIFSFQGAEPAEFDRMRAAFEARLADAAAPLQSMTLEYSFRSATPILALVDQTFADRGASGFASAERHRAFKRDMPGRVDLWPFVPGDGDGRERADWRDPVDLTGAEHHAAILARRIAHVIRTLIETRHPLPVEIGRSGRYAQRPVRPGDILILVRSRGALYSEIIRQCKEAGLPFAGADRLRVMEELAVRDVLALLSFLATPEDDLSLAAALRSPLLGFDEAQLFDLAHGRGTQLLWQRLRDAADLYPETVGMLRALRAEIDFRRPYDLIERILTSFQGRQRLIGRLGAQAADGIDALLAQALAYERTEVPSLTGFLEWARSDTLEIKRAADTSGDALRVMTMHGAKGLEAPIVILPDCNHVPDESRVPRLLRDRDGVMWKLPAGSQPIRQRDAVAASLEAERQESDRLLYVGMTRAEKWLIVASGGARRPAEGSWYAQIADGMRRAGGVPRVIDWGDAATETGLGLGQTSWHDLPEQPPGTAAAPDPAVVPAPAAAPDAPAAAAAPDAPIAPRRVAVRSPSDLGGPKALAGAEGDDTELALARGTALHALLEWLAPLPGPERDVAARRYLDHVPDRTLLGANTDDLYDVQREALAVLDAPHLAFLFAPGSLAEVPVSADLPGIGRIHGVIDRLVVSQERVLAADFKTNRVLPAGAAAVPVGLLRQMGAYHAALGQLWPGRRIETGIVWTRAAHYMPLPEDLVLQSMAQIAAS